MKTSTRASLVATAIAVAIAATGCTSGNGATGDEAAVSLAVTKPVVQYLRNAALNRVPIQSVDSIAEPTDTSVACLSAEEDPDGLLRSWRSSFTMAIVSGHAFRVDAIAANLAQSFTDEGWAATTANDGSIALDNTTLAVDILITPESVSDTEANLLFEANGICVETAGKDSDEVRSLETPPES